MLLLLIREIGTRTQRHPAKQRNIYFSGSVVIAYEREKKGGKNKWRSAFSISWVLVDFPKTKTPTSILSYGQLNHRFYNQARPNSPSMEDMKHTVN